MQTMQSKASMLRKGKVHKEEEEDALS